MPFSPDSVSNNEEAIKNVDSSEVVESEVDKQVRLEAKFGNPEDVVGKAQQGPDMSTNFEGSKIFLFDKDGTPIRYALSRNEQGKLEGYSFLVQGKGQNGSGEGWTDSTSAMHNLERSSPNNVDHRIAWTQRMSQAELEAVEKILGERI